MAKLNTVISALIAGDITALNTSFASVSMEDMKTIRNNFNDFYSKFKAANEAAEAAAKERKAQIETETKALVDALVTAGLDLEMAAEVASQKMAVKYPELAGKPETGKSWSFETVFVNVDGEKLEIGTKGNKGSMKALKAARDAIAAGEYKDRAEWIAAHAWTETEA
ncbi:hypothetical protein [Klebsiella phage phiKp_21]|nr:hypothetical protein [Klebsiella phage phiKp_21]